MKKIKVLQLGIAAILLLCAVFCQAQRKQDTVKVVLLVCDTAKIMKIGWDYFKEDTAATRRYADTTTDKYFGYIGKWTRDTTWHEPSRSVYWVYGYSVREKHNTDEGKLDPYHSFGYVSRDYWVHIFYLDDKKQPLKSTVIVWQSVSAK